VQRKGVLSASPLPSPLAPAVLIAKVLEASVAASADAEEYPPPADQF
jgi:hypothetical protein